MCWSGEASLGVAAVGVAGSLWARRSGVPRSRWATLLYFTGMELLQAATYTVIDRCGLPTNTWLTRASYVHIALQPFFINLLALSFVPENTRRRMRPVALAACAVGAMVMLSKLFVPSPTWACDSAVASMCGGDTCSYHGEWHIAWRLYLTNVDNNFFAYWLAAFCLPVFYGSWRWTLYHLLVGPFTAFLATSNKDEMTAIWCLTSIGFLIALHWKPLEHWMETRLRVPAVPPLLDFARGFLFIFALVGSYTLLRFLRGSALEDIGVTAAITALAVVLGCICLATWWRARPQASQAAGPVLGGADTEAKAAL